MKDRLMAEVQRRAAGRPQGVAGEQQLRPVEHLIDHAIKNAYRHPDSPAGAMRRSLKPNGLTVGLVPTGKTEVIAKIRENVLTRLSQSPLIDEVYQALSRGEEVVPAKLAAAREALYSLPTKTATHAGITPHLLEDFGFSLPKGLMAVLPLLGLVREGFGTLDWTSEEQAIKNVRYNLFKHHPGLREEVAGLEAVLAAGGPVSATQLRAFNAVRLRVNSLVTEDNLSRSDLGGYRRLPYFKDIKEVMTKCFPFVTQRAFRKFVGEFDLTDVADLRRAYALIRSRHKRISEEQLFKLRRQKIMATTREKFTLNMLLSAFRKILLGWRIGRFVAPAGVALAPKRLFVLFLRFVGDRSAQAEIAHDLHALSRSVGFLSKEMVQLNRSGIRWVREYGFDVFPDLFGMTFEEYLKSAEFWDAKPKNK